MTVPVIDAHHHLWDPARAVYPWMDDSMAPIVRRFGVDDLEPLLSGAGIDGTVVVQARHELAESRELLAIAATTPFIVGVVAWIDLTAPDVADTIAALRAGPGGERLVGIRHQVHDEPDPEWLSRADVRRGLDAVATARLAYDLLVRPREYPAAAAVARDLPGLRFVIDHLGKPSIRDGTMEPWAQRPSCVRGDARTSGASSRASSPRRTGRHGAFADLAPYVESALATFGPGRLLFGSDWPVCLLACSYVDVVNAARELCAGLSQAEQAAIFGGTARKVYGLREPA